MKVNQIKLFLVAIIILPILVVAVVNTNSASAVSNGQDDDEVADLYKKNTCFACHKADASKFFDPAKTDEEMVEAIMKGKKGEKPPFMPGYEKKGMTAEQATALVAYMRKLRNPEATTSQTEKGRVLPDVIVLAENSKLGKVTFNHGNHITKNFNLAGTAPIKCTECHHVEQPASEAVKTPPLKTVYPADRTATLTRESLTDPKTPAVTSCRSCHISKDTEPTILTEIPQIEDEKSKKTITLTNQNAFHRNCTGCHNQVVKERPTAEAPTSMKCTKCHKKG